MIKRTNMIPKLTALSLRVSRILKNSNADTSENGNRVAKMSPEDYILGRLEKMSFPEVYKTSQEVEGHIAQKIRSTLLDEYLMNANTMEKTMGLDISKMSKKLTQRLIKVEKFKFN